MDRITYPWLNLCWWKESQVLSIFINFWNWFSQRGPNINKEVIKSIANDFFIGSYQIIPTFESALNMRFLVPIYCMFYDTPWIFHIIAIFN